MDLLIIGKFIQEQRKAKGLTQTQLAEKILVTDKTVSKWECGKGFPDSTLILPLCHELGITANELLSGKKISDEEYKSQAEDNIVTLLNEKKENKKKIILASIVAIISIISCITINMLAGLLDIPEYLRIILIGISVVIMILGVMVACILDNDAGTFECPHCKTRFKPTMKAYIMGPHTLLKRQLKCPHCKKISYCKKRLIK